MSIITEQTFQFRKTKLHCTRLQSKQRHYTQMTKKNLKPMWITLVEIKGENKTMYMDDPNKKMDQKHQYLMDGEEERLWRIWSFSH